MIYSLKSTATRLPCSLILCRPATDDEVKSAGEFLTGARAKLERTGTAADKLEIECLSSLVRVFFRLNEFLYLD